MNDDRKLSQDELESAQFFSLVLSLSNSAMLAMGKSPNPITGKVERDMLQAQQTIDLLSMLKNKTKGNLTDKEQLLLDNSLTNLRLTCARELQKPVEPEKPVEDTTAGQSKAEEKPKEEDPKPDESPE